MTFGLCACGDGDSEDQHSPLNVMSNLLISKSKLFSLQENIQLLRQWLQKKCVYMCTYMYCMVT